jgi:hypothetical protein
MAKSKQNADDTTLKLIEEVKRRRAEISKAERSTWLTNSSFSYVEGSSNGVNLKVVTDLKQLIAIASFLKVQETHYKAAALELGVENPPPFTWSGFSYADWIEDLKTRIGKIQLEAKRQKLATLEARLDAVISPELKREMELAKIAEELGS